MSFFLKYYHLNKSFTPIVLFTHDYLQTINPLIAQPLFVIPAIPRQLSEFPGYLDKFILNIIKFIMERNVPYLIFISLPSQLIPPFYNRDKHD